MGYLTVGELVQKTGIPETTVRRYLGTYISFIDSKKVGHVKKYHPDTTKILEKVYKMHQNGNKAEEIFSSLSQSEPQYLEIQQKNQLETSPVGEVLDILHKMQQKIDSLEEEIRELKEVSGERDVKLVQEMRKLLEEKEKKKPFWKSWFS